MIQLYVIIIFLLDKNSELFSFVKKKKKKNS